jgi:hypothetical protein
MLRAKIDLRKHRCNQLLTQAEDRDRDGFKSRFKEHPFPKVRGVPHLNPGSRKTRRAGCGGCADRLCREPPQRPTRARGASGARSQARASAPTSLPREVWLCCSFMKSTRPRDGESHNTATSISISIDIDIDMCYMTLSI